MENKIQLNRNQRRVLNMVPSGGGNPIPISEIASTLGMSKRTVASLINQLTLKGIPIGSLRQAERNGVFIPLSNEERKAGLMPIRSQTADMAKRIEMVEHASLNDWRNLIEVAE